MSYNNQYPASQGGPYHNPQGYGNYGPPPGMGAPPGAYQPPGMPGAPPGMAPPGMAPPGMAPPGMQQPPQAQQANRPGGLPSHFQPPANMPQFDMNAPVIRLGTTPTTGGRSDPPPRDGGRPGLGMDRGAEHQGRSAPKDAQTLVPPTPEEKLKTIFLTKIPEGVGGDEGIERLLRAVGRLRQWDSVSGATFKDYKGPWFGFAGFDDPESLSVAVKIFLERGVEVPTKRQSVVQERPEGDDFEGIEKEKLQVTVDASSAAYAKYYTESKADEVERALQAATDAVKEVLRDMFYPPKGSGLDTEGDVTMANAENGNNVEVVSIPLAQDDELSDIPAEMRAMVAGEIAAFRERSHQQDLERLRQEEEAEALEKQRTAASRSRLESPPPSAAPSNIPAGPRGVPNAPSGPRGMSGPQKGVNFVNGKISYGTKSEEEDSDLSDREIFRRYEQKRKDEENKGLPELRRKWLNRERSRAAALEREKAREETEARSFEQRKQEAMVRDAAWTDESLKQHPFYRDHAAWSRKRRQERQEEEALDAYDRRLEQEEVALEQRKARGMADSFLDRQAEEMAQPESVAAAPQPFKLSLGAAAQKNQASRSGPQRRTIAEVEGLLDDEEADAGTKRQLVPIQFDSAAAASSMTDEEISQAVRSLAQEIPAEKEGLWKWNVKWDYMDEGVISGKLRPFVEKKIVEYLGVQEEMLVETVEEHLKKHGTAGALVEELEGALDDEAEDLVKKLWRMVIFFTECEKRGLPA